LFGMPACCDLHTVQQTNNQPAHACSFLGRILSESKKTRSTVWIVNGRHVREAIIFHVCGPFVPNLSSVYFSPHATCQLTTTTRKTNGFAEWEVERKPTKHTGGKGMRCGRQDNWRTHVFGLVQNCFKGSDETMNSAGDWLLLLKRRIGLVWEGRRMVGSIAVSEYLGADRRFRR